MDRSSFINVLVGCGMGTLIGYSLAKHSHKQHQHNQTNEGIKVIKIDANENINDNINQGVINIEIKESGIYRVAQLKETVGIEKGAMVPNIMWKKKIMNKVIRLKNFQTENDVILYDIVRKLRKQEHLIEHIYDYKIDNITGFVRAGPREKCWFNPRDINVVLCTTGGLCPGLNNIIRGITLALIHTYGVKNVYGVSNGFHGFRSEPIELTSCKVRHIHEMGGSIIGTNRGGFDSDIIINWCLKYGVYVIILIGGDGTHRAGNILYNEISKKKLNICVACVPKTIDNDIAFIDRSFGFDTAVEEAAKVVKCAVTEAKSTPRGIGIVRLMGRTAGSIAAFTAMSTGLVDLCLIPEQPIIWSGEYGGLTWIERVIERKGYAVIVLAEGIYDKVIESGEKENLIEKDLLEYIKMKNARYEKNDEGGNKRIYDAGPIVVEIVKNYFKDNRVHIKYIDPSYIIRSVPANSSDSVMCLILSQSVAHGVMSGYTGFSVGVVNNRTVYIPIGLITAHSPKLLRPNGRTWERICITTGQPDVQDLN